jgi:hypothetical protein
MRLFIVYNYNCFTEQRKQKARRGKGMNELELEERISNIEAHIKSVEMDMIDYMETNPKGDDDWFEVRLRTLERQIKELRNAKG